MLHENRDYTLKVFADKVSGYWRVNIWIPSLPPQLRRFRPSLGVSIEEPYQRAFIEWKRSSLPQIIQERVALAEKETEAAKPPAGTRLSEIIDWYVHSRMPFNGNTQKSIDRYAQILRDFELFCRARHIGRVEQLSWPKIEEWQAWMLAHRPPAGSLQVQRLENKLRQARERNARPNTIEKLEQQLESAKAKPLPTKRGKYAVYDEVSVVRRMLIAAHEAELVENIPITRWLVPKPKGKSKYRGHSLETVQAFLKLIAEKEPQILDHCAWCLSTGWDPGNMLDFDETLIDWTVPAVRWERLKTEEDMDWPLSPQLVELIKQRIAKLGPGYKPGMKLFDLPGNSKKKKVEYFHRHVSRCCERHGFTPRVIPRDFRITFGSLHASGALNRDANGNPIPTPPKVLQKLFCHRIIETTMNFYHDVDHDALAYWSGRGVEAIFRWKTEDEPSNVVPLNRRR